VIGKIQRKTNEIVFRESMKRHKLLMQTNAEIFEINQQGTANYNDAVDRSHRDSTNAIRGTVDLQDPFAGETRNLDDTSETYWNNPLQDVIGSDAPGYDPNADTSVKRFDWTKMRRVRQRGSPPIS
jgi:hypothetical protein